MSIPKRELKLSLILLNIIITYVFILHVSREISFQRYENLFVSVIEMYLHGHINLDLISVFPLISSTNNIDQSLSELSQSAIRCVSFFPNMIMIFLILHFITGLPPQLLEIMPLGVLFVPFAYMMLINKLVQDSILRILLLFYILIYLISTKYYGSFYVAPVSIILIIMIIYNLNLIYRKEESYGKRFLLLMICLFSLVHYWHTASSAVIALILSSYAILCIMYMYYHGQDENIPSPKSFLYFILIAIIIILTFTHLWESNYTSDFFNSGNLADYFSKALTKLYGNEPYYIDYSYNYKDNIYGTIYFYSLLSIMVISSILMAATSLLYIKLVSKRYNLLNIIPFVLTSGLIGAQIIHSVLYYKAYSINFFFIPLFYAIFGSHLYLESMLKIKPYIRNIYILGISLLIILALLCTVSYYTTNEQTATSITKYDNTKYSFLWIYLKSGNNVVISDFNIIYKYLQRESYFSEPSLEYIHMTPEIYGVLVGDKNLPKSLEGSCIAIDHATMIAGLPIHVLSSRARLEPRYTSINSCVSQDKIYMDNSISIYKFIKKISL